MDLLSKRDRILSDAGSSAGDDWDSESLDTKTEHWLEDAGPSYVRRNRTKRHEKNSVNRKLRRKKCSKTDLASVFAKQEDLCFEQKKPELEQQKDMKEKEFAQEKGLRGRN